MIHQPYLYGAQSQYSVVDPFKTDFDPKSHTRASWQTPPPTPTKSSGPLLNFNQHPDSWVAKPYGNTNAEAMPPNTVRKIKAMRGSQLGLRLIQMLGALGLLFCAISLKNTSNLPSYVLRVTPAVEILTTGYAIYHLCHSANRKDAASSASYHFFALIIDLALVPFYTYVALTAKSMQAQLQDPSASKDLKWTSFFDSSATVTIVMTTWLASIVVGALHCITTVLSLCLVYLFRAISRLPPDLNPFESNLTSRRSRKHKYKNSELSISEPKLMSTSTLSLTDTAKSSPTKLMPTATSKPISFLHTRTESDHHYSPHNPLTAAAASRSNVALSGATGMYQQQPYAQTSRNDLANRLPADDGQTYSPTNYSHNFRSEPSSHESTMTATLSKAPSVSSTYTAATKSTVTPPLPRKSSRRHSGNTPSDNWFAYYGAQPADSDLGNRALQKENKDPAVSIVEEDDDEEYDPYRPESIMPSSDSIRGFGFGNLRNPATAYQALAPTSNSNSPRAGQAGARYNKVDFNPLGMNPPTPKSTHFHDQALGQDTGSFTRVVRPLSAVSGNTNAQRNVKPASNNDPWSDVDLKSAQPQVANSNHTTPNKSVGTPTKSRFYGDLNSAMTGVRGQSPSPTRSQQPPTYAIRDGPARVGVIERRDWAADDGGTKGRVISRTGLDDVVDVQGYGREGLRGRNVSGKVAEEGRAGPTSWRSWAR